MFNVETRATAREIVDYGHEVLGRELSVAQSGRLGREVALPEGEAQQLADRLRQAGREVVCVERGTPGGWHLRTSQQ